MIKRIAKTLKPYLIATFATFFILLTVAGVGLDVSIPLDFNWDAIMTYVGAKLAIQDSFLFNVPQTHLFGAPFGLSFGAFPCADSNLFFMTVKTFYLFYKNIFTSVNMYYFLTFFLTTLSSLFVLKKFRVKNNIGIILSLLYSFAPFHFTRGIRHIIIASYFLVPLMTLILFRIWSKKPLFFKKSEEHFKLDFLCKRSLFVILVLALVACSSIYFNFFFMFFLFIVSISACIYRKNIFNLLGGLIVIAILFAFTLINYSPYIHYSMTHKNVQAVERNFAQTEYYGLSVTRLLMPLDNHRIQILAKFKEYYSSKTLTKNEIAMETLGLFCSLGFIFLIFNFLFSKRDKFTTFNKLGFLTVSAVLLTTRESFMVLLAIMGLGQFRSSNRISIFIMFFAIVALALILNKAGKKISKNTFNLLMLLFLFLGIFDQTTLYFNYTIPQKLIIKKEFDSLKNLTKEMENTYKKDSMVYTLPYMEYPEIKHKVGHLQDYELAKPMLFSDKLRYSYGTIKGSKASKYYSKLSRVNVDEMLKSLCLAGFSGILINKNGYLIYPNELKKLDKIPIISSQTSKDGVWIWYNIEEYKKKVLSGYTDKEIKLMQDNFYYNLKD